MRRKFTEIIKTTKRPGKALEAINFGSVANFNFAKGEYEDANGRSLFLKNPVDRLSHTLSWFRVAPRTGVIKMYDLKAWFNAVIDLPDDTVVCKAGTTRYYMLTLLFTGLRRQEAPN